LLVNLAHARACVTGLRQQASQVIDVYAGAERCARHTVFGVAGRQLHMLTQVAARQLAGHVLEIAREVDLDAGHHDGDWERGVGLGLGHHQETREHARADHAAEQGKLAGRLLGALGSYFIPHRPMVFGAMACVKIPSGCRTGP
jgi:hypothetical protein